MCLELPDLGGLDQRPEHVTCRELKSKRGRNQISRHSTVLRLSVARRERHGVILWPPLQNRPIDRRGNVLIPQTTDGGTTNVMRPRRDRERRLGARAHMRERISLPQVFSRPDPAFPLG